MYYAFHASIITVNNHIICPTKIWHFIYFYLGPELNFRHCGDFSWSLLCDHYDTWIENMMEKNSNDNVHRFMQYGGTYIFREPRCMTSMLRPMHFAGAAFVLSR